MKLLMKLLISTIAVLVAAHLLPGVFVEGFYAAAITAIVLGLLNVFVKPVLVILTLPINILTLGLFTLVLNILLIMLASNLVVGFTVMGFLDAFLFGLVMSFVNSFLGMLAK